MSSNFLVGACIALGILGTWNTWTLYQVNQRLAVIEKMDNSASNVASTKSVDKTGSVSYQSSIGEATRQKKRKYISPSTLSPTDEDTDQPAIDLTDPEIQETIAKIAETNAKRKEEERRQSKMEAYKTSIKYELENFATEKDYDTDTVQNIGTILDDSSDEWRAVREQVREGDISWIDARTEFKAIGEETKDKITEYISEEDYTELRSRLWGDWSQ